MKTAGRLATWAGALLVVISLFLPYAVSGPSSMSEAIAGSVITILLAIAAATASSLTLFLDEPILTIAQAGVSFVLLGQSDPIFVTHFAYLGIGYWLGFVAVLAMAVGASLSIAAIWPLSGWKSTTGWAGKSTRSVWSIPPIRPGSATHDPRLSPGGGAMPGLESDAKLCPACTETVRSAAKRCRYCGHQFDAEPSEPMCANGHTAAEGDQFCASCGAAVVIER